MTATATSGLADAAAWVTIFTGPLAVIGIGLAWFQLRRTANAAEATKTAVERTARDMALYQLLVLLPQLQQHEAALDAAVNDGDGARVVAVLNDWRKTGTEVRGLLDSRPHRDTELMEQLQTSFVDAFDAKSNLLLDPDAVVAATAGVRESIGEVTVLVGSLTGQLKANIGGDSV